MNKIFFLLVVMVGVVGGMYGSIARLNGMGLYFAERNSFSYGQVVDDPIFIIENGSLVYRLSNEIALEPWGFLYSGDWRTAFG